MGTRSSRICKKKTEARIKSSTAKARSRSCPRKTHKNYALKPNMDHFVSLELRTYLDNKESKESGYEGDDEEASAAICRQINQVYPEKSGYEDKKESKSTLDYIQIGDKGGLEIEPVYKVFVNEELQISPEYLAFLRATHRRRLSKEEEERRLAQFTQRQIEAHLRHQARQEKARKGSKDEDSGPPPVPPTALKQRPEELTPVRDSYLPPWMKRRKKRRKRKRRRKQESSKSPGNTETVDQARIQEPVKSPIVNEPVEDEPVRPVINLNPEPKVRLRDKPGVGTQTTPALSSSSWSGSTDSSGSNSGSGSDEDLSEMEEPSQSPSVVPLEPQKPILKTTFMNPYANNTSAYANNPKAVAFTSKESSVTSLTKEALEPEPGEELTLNELERRFYYRMREHTRSKAKVLLEEEKARRQEFNKAQAPIYEDVSPYWSMQADQGPAVMKPMLREYIAAKKERLLKEKEMEDEHPVYITSGKSDNSISMAPTIPSRLSDFPAHTSSALGFFHKLDMLIIRHEVYIWDEYLPCKSRVKVKFKLVNGRAHKVFFLYEQKKGCCKQRTDLNGFDYYNMERTHSIKFKLYGPNFCYRRSVNIYSPPTNYMGCVVQSWYPIPKFECRDPVGNVVATIRLENICKQGPLRRAFMIRDDQGVVIGDIRRNCDDLLQHLFLRRELCGIHYTKEVGVGTKALLLGGTMMIYKAYYAKKYVKKVFHDVTDERRYYWDYENVMANRPSFESSLGTMVNYDQPEWRTFRVNEVNRDKCLRRASRWKVGWT